MLYVEVILPLPLESVFTYSVPDLMAEKVKMGVRVLVPLGKSKTYTAMAVRTHSQKPDFQTRDILQVIDAEPVLLEKQLKLWQWIATYYMAPLGDVFKAALPAGLKAEENYKPRTVRCVTLAEKLRPPVVHGNVHIVRHRRRMAFMALLVQKHIADHRHSERLESAFGA